MADPPQPQPGFTLRAAIIAVALSLFLLACSSYVALKLGIAPWPIIFSVVVSASLIKLLNRSGGANIHEINVAQAGASIGGLVAAGVVFTVPGILFLAKNRGLEVPWPNPWLLGLLTASAGVLGLLLSVPLKYTFVDQENLPYPAGTAGAELLKVGQTGGRQLALVVMVGALAAIFALSRDLWFAGGFQIAALAGFGVFVTLQPFPLFLAGGYILGTKSGYSWLGGAVLGWVVIVPILFQFGFDFLAARAFARNLGMGIVLGGGLGFFVAYLFPRIKQLWGSLLKVRKKFLRFAPLLIIWSLLSLMVAGVPPVAALLTLLGVCMMVVVAARMTGETNIDPLEQFGIFVGLVVATAYHVFNLDLTPRAAFMIVTFVSVACAIAGDAGHDYKSAAIIGTKFRDVVKVDFIAVVFAGFAAPFVLDVIRLGFGDVLFTSELPAPQAQMVAGSIFGFEYPTVFAAGMAVGFVGQFLNKILPARMQDRILLMPAGIGLFLGLSLALPLAAGAFIRSLIDKRKPALFHTGLVIAAGVMGGEGIAGFGAGALTVAGLDFVVSSTILLVPGLLIFLLSFLLWSRAK